MKETDDEGLGEILKTWEVPEMPPSLRENLLRKYRERHRWNWQRLLHSSISIPVPIASLALVLIIALSALVVRQKLQPPPPAPQVQIVDRIVTIPVIQDRHAAKMICGDPIAHPAVPVSEHFTLREFQPIASLMPRIIRGGENAN
jgi:hypothetical protein